jgi:hypothetical protein
MISMLENVPLVILDNPKRKSQIANTINNQNKKIIRAAYLLQDFFTNRNTTIKGDN